MRITLAVLGAFVAFVIVARSVRADFDHNVHERDVFTSGQAALPCTRCHTLTNGLLVGRPDHAACFGACHGSPPPALRTLPKGTKLTVAPERQRLCTSCHREADMAAPIAKRPAVAFPPYAPGDFALAANHLSHAAIACTQCHAVPSDQVRQAKAPRAQPHRRCLGCHDGTKASPMTKCEPCHTPGSGSPLPARLAEPMNTVTATFSHPKHATRGAQCASCHTGVAATNDNILPRPSAAACATVGCHDGAPVFPITAACTRCHTQAPAKFDIVRTTVRFTHATHAPLLPDAPCTTCHKATAGNEVVTSGHGPCASCHADDFMARDPKYCSACHNSTEPWRKLQPDRLPVERTEFGATLSHVTPAHAQLACATCHAIATADSQLRPARGHRACTGAACHATKDGAAPQLGTCDGCHRAQLIASRAAKRVRAPWSVRKLFNHRTHERTTSGAELACTSCHTDLSAPSVDQLATPAKATCKPCHDGATAFKLTGTACGRCHPRVKL